MNMLKTFTRLALVLYFLLACSSIQAKPEYQEVVGELVLHTVQPGEDLFTIAKQYGLALDHIAFANGFSTDARYIKTGTEIIVPTQRILPANPPYNGLVLNLPERGIYLFQKGEFIKFFPCSIGEQIDFRTPPGRYTIIEKIKDPTWYPPSWADEKEPVGPGPDNPLGDRWIGLSLDKTGIHGTNDPLNIGNSVTHGCIRTYPHQLHEIYDSVEVGWTVILEYETVKFGKLDGKPMAVSFLDVYEKSPVYKRAERLMEQLGIYNDITTGNFSGILSLNLGVPFFTHRTQTLYQEVLERSETYPKRSASNSPDSNNT